MDPNAALLELRRLTDLMANRGQRPFTSTVMIDNVDRMIELFQGLDNWLSSGGFPPEVWREGPDARI